MTTPPRTVSVLALATSTVVAVLLLAGACQVPVPTEGDEIAATAQPDQTPPVTAVYTPPTPPSTPPADVEVADSGPSAPEPDPTPAPEVAARTIEASASPQQVPEPGFTTMTVRPVLTNVPDVQNALMREYPVALRDAGIGGAPVLWIHIAADGAVDDTRVFESSGQARLDEAAQRVAEAMHFRPAQNGDETVAVWVQIPIRFRVAN